MANPHGSFIWYELVIPDPEASKAFYDSVVGWTVGPRVAGDLDYRMITAPNGATSGGVMRLTPEMAASGARPGWLGYVGVDDVDAAADKLRALGGAVHQAPWDIPGVGRMAVVADPAGAPFYVMRGATEGATSTVFSPGVAGHVAWNELSTPDPDAALRFYGELFGWASPDRMSMGAMGDYIFLDHHGVRIGAMAGTPGGAPGGWRFYIQAPDVAAATERVAADGGAVLIGPHQVPTGDQIVIATDPQGAEFALVGR